MGGMILFFFRLGKAESEKKESLALGGEREAPRLFIVPIFSRQSRFWEKVGRLGIPMGVWSFVRGFEIIVVLMFLRSGLILGLVCLSAYIAFQPLLALQWQITTGITAQTSSGCHCCKSGCTCSAEAGGCQTLGVAKGVSLSIKGSTCQTDQEKKTLVLHAFRWIVVPELQQFSHKIDWYDMVFDGYDVLGLGQEVGVLDKPPQVAAQLS